MSGSVAIPQPSIARTLVHRPGCFGRYVPMTQDTESPKNVTRGSPPEVPFVRSVRAIGTYTPALDAAGCGFVDVTMTGAADSAGVGAGIVVSTTANAVAPIARTVTPTGARRGRRRCTRRVSAPRRIGCSITKKLMIEITSVAVSRTASSGH